MTMISGEPTRRMWGIYELLNDHSTGVSENQGQVVNLGLGSYWLSNPHTQRASISEDQETLFLSQGTWKIQVMSLIAMGQGLIRFSAGGPVSALHTDAHPVNGQCVILDVQETSPLKIEIQTTDKLLEVQYPISLYLQEMR